MPQESPAKTTEAVERDLVGYVSHELKSPITAIRGSVQVLLDGGATDADDARHFLDIIANQADRANAIIEDLLTLAQVEEDGGQVSIEREPVAVREIVEAAIEACEIRALQTHAQVHMQCEPGLTANVNRRLMEQAVTNLIDNAVKYGQEGCEVEVQARQADCLVAISVRDEGCGIPEEHLPVIFDRFYRVDKARSRELGGTGLGLHIVFNTVTQTLNGTINCESAPATGTKYTITMPLIGKDPTLA